MKCINLMVGCSTRPNHPVGWIIDRRMLRPRTICHISRLESARVAIDFYQARRLGCFGKHWLCNPRLCGLRLCGPRLCIPRMFDPRNVRVVRNITRIYLVSRGCCGSRNSSSSSII